MTELNKLDLYGKCPVCKTDWDGGSIEETFLEQKEKGHWNNNTEEEIKEYVKEFYSPPYRWSNIIAIERQGDDRVSGYMCPECECEFPRFIKNEKE